MGANNGSGRPISFRCSHCRSTLRDKHHGGYRNDVTLTGRKRKLPAGRAGIRNLPYALEYTCGTCGHVGWSRHVDLANLESTETEERASFSGVTKSGVRYSGHGARPMSEESRKHFENIVEAAAKQMGGKSR